MVFLMKQNFNRLKESLNCLKEDLTEINMTLQNITKDIKKLETIKLQLLGTKQEIERNIDYIQKENGKS